jgi:hypothetical protein
MPQHEAQAVACFCFFQWPAALVVGFTVERIAINILTDVLHHVAGGAADFMIDRLHVKARLVAVLTLQLFRILAGGVVFHHFQQLGGMFRQREQQAMPVRRTIVVRLGHPQAKDRNFTAGQLSRIFAIPG